MDVVLHTDAIHRGGGQIIPTARRALLASFLSAKPRIMDPIYLVQIHMEPHANKQEIFRLILKNRGEVIETSRNQDGVHVIRANIPIAQSNDFSSDICQETKGNAFYQYTFDHWKIMDEDPLSTSSTSRSIIMEARKRKGLKPCIPPISRFEDKL